MSGERAVQIREKEQRGREPLLSAGNSLRTVTTRPSAELPDESPALGDQKSRPRLNKHLARPNPGITGAKGNSGDSAAAAKFAGEGAQRRGSGNAYFDGRLLHRRAGMQLPGVPRRLLRRLLAYSAGGCNGDVFWLPGDWFHVASASRDWTMNILWWVSTRLGVSTR